MENDLSRAVVLFLGVGVSPFPRSDAAQLIQEFGETRAAELQMEIAGLLDELDKVEVDWTVHSLQSATELAQQYMAELHADLSVEAVKALGWKFSFDWR